MRRGDIATVAPPGEYGKPRPALILQSDETLSRSTLTYVPITSDLLRIPDVRVAVLPTAMNGVKRPSELMVDMIQTASVGRFGGVIGRLEPLVQMLCRADGRNAAEVEQIDWMGALR
jgi:mRNA interferase MazF